MTTLDGYLREFRAALGGCDEATRRDLLDEIAGHMEERVRSLQLAGASEEEAMNETVSKFGAAREVGDRLRAVHGRGTVRDALLAAVPFALYLSTVWGAEAWPAGFFAGSLVAWLAWGVLAVLVVGAAVGWTRRCLWAYTWVGFASGIGLALLSYVVWPAWTTWAGLVAILQLAVVIWLTRRNWLLAGLALFADLSLSPAFRGIRWASMLESGMMSWPAYWLLLGALLVIGVATTAVVLLAGPRWLRVLGLVVGATVAMALQLWLILSPLMLEFWPMTAIFGGVFASLYVLLPGLLVAMGRGTRWVRDRRIRAA